MGARLEVVATTERAAWSSAKAEASWAGRTMGVLRGKAAARRCRGVANRCVGVAALCGLGVCLAVLGGVSEDLSRVGGTMSSGRASLPREMTRRVGFGRARGGPGRGAGGLDAMGHVVDLLVANGPLEDVLAAWARLVPAHARSTAMTLASARWPAQRRRVGPLGGIRTIGSARDPRQTATRRRRPS
jgi:hypothetical protein